MKKPKTAAPGSNVEIGVPFRCAFDKKIYARFAGVGYPSWASCRGCIARDKDDLCEALPACAGSIFEEKGD